MYYNGLNADFETRFEPWEEEIECIVTVVFFDAGDLPLFQDPDFLSGKGQYEGLCGTPDFKYAIFDHQGNFLTDLMDWVIKQGDEVNQEVWDLCAESMINRMQAYVKESRFAI